MTRTRRHILESGAALFACAATRAASGGADAPLVVFAAASLTDGVQRLAAAAERAGIPRFNASFAASSLLARQIEQGAGADLFASADTEWMDYLEARGLLRPGSRRNVLSTRLVIVAARDRSSRAHSAEDGADASRDSLRAMLEVRLGQRGRLAVGDPSHVPAGRYARAALSWLAAWTRLEPRLAPAENVRSALAFVVRGEAPLGIVYETDALAEPRVEVVGRFPAAAHPPITYPFALTRMARDGTDQLLAHLAGPAAAPTWRALGFIVLPGA